MLREYPLTMKRLHLAPPNLWTKAAVKKGGTGDRLCLKRVATKQITLMAREHHVPE
jgi:hypothetical protein